MAITRKAGLLFIFAVAILTANCEENAAPAGNKYFIFIVIDTLRYDHLGINGYKVNTSPEIDRLAKESIVFDHAYATAPWTLPSVGSMFTGVYPGLLGIAGEFVRIGDNIEALPQLFKEKGYRTAAIVSHFLVSPKFGFSKGFDHFDEEEGGKGHSYISSENVTRRTVEYLEKNADKPMFLFLHYFDPHYEYLMHDILNTYKDYKGVLGDNFLVHKIRNLDYADKLTKEDLRYIEARYDSEVRFTDFHLGRVLDKLRRLGIYDNATIVLLGDHGEELGEAADRWIGHTKKLSKAIIHVPLMIKLPHGQGKRRVDGKVSLIDVGQTIAALAGLRPLKGPLVSGKAWNLRNSNVSSSSIYSETKRWVDLQAVMADNWKLIFDKQTHEHELFNLKKDPDEKTNLVNVEIGVFESMNQKRRAIEIEQAKLAKKLKLEKKNVDLSGKQIEQLKNLGYIQ